MFIMHSVSRSGGCARPVWIRIGQRMNVQDRDIGSTHCWGGESVKEKNSLLRKKLDQYQYLGFWPPTPPLTQQQSIDNNLGLMLG